MVTKKQRKDYENKISGQKILIDARDSEIKNLKNEIELKEEAYEAELGYVTADYNNAFDVLNQFIRQLVKDCRKQKVIDYFDSLINNEVIENNVSRYMKTNGVQGVVPQRTSNLEMIACSRTLGKPTFFKKHPDFVNHVIGNPTMVECYELDEFGKIYNTEYGKIVKINTNSIPYKRYQFDKAINGITYYLVKSPDKFSDVVEYFSNNKKSSKAS